MNNKSIGEISEAMIIAALIKAGCTVSIPFGDNQRYDLIIEHRKKPGFFLRVQCKTGRLQNGDYIKFPVASMTKHGRKHYRGQIDLFAIYCPENGNVYVLPISICGNSSVSLRISKPKNNQCLGMHWANKYLLK